MQASIQEELMYRGCNPNPKIIVPSQEIVTIGTYIKSLNLENHVLRREKLRKILKSSKEFLNSYYDLHYVPCEIKKENPIFKLEYSGDIDPFKLPVQTIKDEDDFYGCLREIISASDEIKITFRSIELAKDITSISALSYTHEITHTQLNHMRGLIQEYYNTEVLSIFNELLHAFATDHNEELLKEHDARRLNDVAVAIRELEKYNTTQDEEIKNILLEGSCYCESTLKAYNLFIRYYYGTTSIRKHIIKVIQSVFDGDLTLEEALEKLDISFENSQDIRVLTKYMKR